MCYKLSAESLVLNYFRATQSSSISISKLNDLSKQIIKQCNSGIQIESSKEDIIAAVNRHNDLLAYNGNTISASDIKAVAEQCNKHNTNIGVPGLVRERCNTVFGCDALGIQLAR